MAELLPHHLKGRARESEPGNSSSCVKLEELKATSAITYVQAGLLRNS
jgi:hypothetical protein